MPPKRQVELDPEISQEEVQRYVRLKRAVEEKRQREEGEKQAAKRAELLAECPHPLALAMKFDQNIVSTPAVELISKTWARILRTPDGRCITSQPPQTGKSLTARWMIFWALLENPNRRCVFASYGMSLARTSGRIIRSLIEMYGKDYGLLIDDSHADAADWQLRSYEGGCLSAGVGSSLTGRPSDLMLLDDLLSGQAEANSETVKRNIEDWWETVARTRMAPGAPAIAIGTRWALDDVLAKFAAEGWERINIPAIADGETFDSLKAVHGGRTDDGYLISTRGTTPEDWDRIRSEMGERAFWALLQGMPTPLEGGVWQRSWLEAARVGIEGKPPVPLMSEIAVGVDPAETGTGDEAGIIVMGVGLEDNGLYVIGDLSGLYTAAQWARKVCIAWLTYDANRIIQERSIGSRNAVRDAWSILRRQAVAITAYGGLEEASRLLREAGDDAAADQKALREVEPFVDQIVDAGPDGPRVVTVTPRQSKLIRAESAAAPFETGRAHMAGYHAQLEHQMLTWNPRDSKSPDRVDALALLVSQLERGNRSRVLV